MSARKRRCPTPDKVRYATKWQAVNAMRRMPLGRMEIRAYRCKGHYHLTSKARA